MGVNLKELLSQQRKEADLAVFVSAVERDNLAEHIRHIVIRCIAGQSAAERGQHDVAGSGIDELDRKATGGVGDKKVAAVAESEGRIRRVDFYWRTGVRADATTGSPLNCWRYGISRAIRGCLRDRSRVGPDLEKQQSRRGMRIVENDRTDARMNIQDGLVRNLDGDEGRAANERGLLAVDERTVRNCSF